MEEEFRQATAPATTVFTAVFTAVSVLDAMKTVPLSVSPWLKVRRRAARFAGLWSEAPDSGMLKLVASPSFVPRAKSQASPLFVGLPRFVNR